MAVTSSGWVSIVGGTDTGADVEAKLDTAFSNIDSAMVVNDANEAAIATMNTCISVLTTTPKTAQTLVASTPTKLEYMTTSLVSNGGTAMSHTLSTHNIVILEAGIYRMHGSINLDIPVGDDVTVELYVNGVASGMKQSETGKNTSITFSYGFMNSFAINDDLTIYVTSSGTTVTVEAASVTIEKTNF